MADELKSVVIPYLSSQFSRARPVLFTGAGFSASARNITGMPVPTGRELAEHVWKLSFPGEVLEPATTLQLIYEHAHRHHPGQLRELLTRLLTVDAETVPEWYARIFRLPWHRVYTLNIDDLALAVSRRYGLARRPVQVSATSLAPERPAHGDVGRDLEIVHLNGTKEDLPDRVTFSATQYAERLAMQDPWYARLVADIASRPFIFIGTSLDESPLWQHIELRELRGGRAMREFRPRSYLVTPSLDRARRSLLQEFNIAWLPMTAEAFSDQVVAEMSEASASGLELIARESAPAGSGRTVIPEVAKLATDPTRRTEFLLGQEPIWADIQSGRAVSRAIDAESAALADARLAADQPGVIVISGTAGSGKSASLMRLSLALSAAGASVGWLDRDTDMTSREIRGCMQSPHAPRVLAIDDGDLFGNELSPMVRELALSEAAPLILVAVRATKVDRALNPAILAEVPLSELTMPLLADADIDSLLDSLTTDNKLGKLKGKTRRQQRAIFREQCGRQLLVAMIEATSGERFEDKAVREFHELDEAARLTYALVATSSSMRYSLGRDEIMIATGDRSNAALNTLDALLRRGIIVQAEDGRKVRARHRVIADIILEELRRAGLLSQVLSGLALVAATKVAPNLHRSARPWRFLRQVISHEFLARTLGVEGARELYGAMEDLLSWDYHYWLQRGSLEVQVGNLRLAQNYLQQARGIAHDDPIVETEWALFLFRRATSEPLAAGAESMATEARESLLELIRIRGRIDPYPFHVLAKQGLWWSRRPTASMDGRARYLANLISTVQDGMRLHPNAGELELIHEELKREYMSLALSEYQTSSFAQASGAEDTQTDLQAVDQPLQPRPDPE
ncbi:MAG: SIR2 family protein [Candidatus Limnocylindrales bacterium]